MSRPVEPCFVIAGTLEDARWAAAGANLGHGLKRDNKAKNAAAVLALVQRPRSSNEAVAEHCGVSHTMVSNVRRELAEAAEKDAAEKGPLATVASGEAETRTGKDGRTIKTGNIGGGQQRKDDAEPQADAGLRDVFPDRAMLEQVGRIRAWLAEVCPEEVMREIDRRIAAYPGVDGGVM
jgi:hypothetical protein